VLEEQAETVRVFRTHYVPNTVERMVVYGTGLHAEAVITSCKDYPIEGLMDASKTGKMIWGKRVLSEEEVLCAGIKLVVVIARPAVHGIIYKRLQKWSEKHTIRILDIRGNNIADRLKNSTCDSAYYNKSYKKLLEEIDRHDVISFDIFDTLLTRKVYESHDVFSLLDLEYGERFSFVFSEERKRAQQELSVCAEPDIDMIYQRIKENNLGLSEEECEYLKKREIQKEKQVLVLRRRMVDCLKYCADRGKRIFLVSDMYLPKKVLESILSQFGITQYNELFVSCDYKITKEKGLFKEVKKQIKPEETCLHIGDHSIADGEMARKNGIDSFLIMSPIRMMEISAYGSLLVHVGGIESRLMLGFMISEVFNDPFSLYQSKGKPLIKESRSFGYVFIAPLLFSFLVWMFEQLKEVNSAVLLFSARDGWLLHQVYGRVAEIFGLSRLPQSYYLLISRRAMQAINKPEAEAQKECYLKYLEGLQLEKYEQIYFFDFMSRGSCQYYLEQALCRKLHGLYFQKSNSGDREKENLNVECYFKDKNALDSERQIFRLCDFLECIFTSFHPSFTGFTERFEPVYERERRTKEQLACVRDIHTGIKDYCECFAEIISDFPREMPSEDFCDGVLRLIGSDYTRIEIEELKELTLDDAVYGDKNAGRDALM
jgi:HAD superfamily hydrolase (TIGR01549 family)